ncbi:MAG: SulP family inorganic anion transporter, partial [Proteobacteria bacterium]|nr:SulP family inorganic anion transporter [Pseudomonadota bacterium]
MNRFNLSHEIRTGFLVSIIALPLCLGISMASGFPAAAGIVTAIIGGLLASRLGGSPLTIEGPAAGLIVIVLAGVMELGGGSASVGYSRMLTAIAVAAMFQIAFGALRMGRFSSLIPPSVVHGMLAGIGVIIFAKQIHVLLGAAPMAKSPVALIQEIPHSIANLNPAVAGIGFLVLGVLVGFNYLPAWISSKVPPQLVALAIAVPVALFLDFSHAHNLVAAGSHVHVGPEYL